MSPDPIISALRQHAPPLMRWAGAIAKRLRQFNIALTGKHSGNANTDALTLADLTVQELLVAGLRGYPPDEMPGSIYPLLATGEFGGSLIHSPNIYDFPVSLHLARILGGDAVWVHNQQPVNFDEMWMDDRADMLRLPGIVACAVNRESLKTLCELAKDWNPVRYVD